MSALDKVMILKYFQKMEKIEEEEKQYKQVKFTCLDFTSLYSSILLKMKDEDIIKMNIDLTEYDPRSQIRKELGIKD